MFLSLILKFAIMFNPSPKNFSSDDWYLLSIQRENFRKYIGKILRDFRKTCGYSQKDFAAIIGLDQSNYCRYENGSPMTLDMLYIICNSLGLKITISL